MRTADVRMKGRVVKIVDIVVLKFASDEAAECKVDILEPLLFIETSLPNTTVVLLELHLLSRCKPGKRCTFNKQYALLSQLRLLTRVYDRQQEDSGGRESGDRGQ